MYLFNNISYLYKIKQKSISSVVGKEFSVKECIFLDIHGEHWVQSEVQNKYHKNTKPYIDLKCTKWHRCGLL
jgi:hypothetical protein